jgi:hypothetical protein
MEINTNTNTTDTMSVEEILEREERKMNEETDLLMQKRLEELKKRDPFIYK